MIVADQWNLTNCANPAHAEWAAAQSMLFASSQWAEVLTALGASPRFAWNGELRMGVVIPVFKRMGFRVGVLGFPVAGRAWDEMPLQYALEHARSLASKGGLAMLRLTRSFRNVVEAGATAARPEVWLEDLPLWGMEGQKRLRKDLAFARRSSAGVRVEPACYDAPACHRLYADAVTAHRGALRYTSAYFEALRSLTERCSALRIFSAMDKKDRTRGFAVLATHGRDAYYLHGAVDGPGRQQGISDLLLDALVARAVASGAERLSLMSSPWEQPGLVKFKRKWGNNLGLSVTYDVANGVAGHALRSVARWQARDDRRHTYAASVE